MKLKRIVGCLAVAVSVNIVSISPAHSAGSGKGLDPQLVFEIGGKAKIKRRKNRSIPLEAGVSWKQPSCSNYDMSLSVSNVLNGVSGKLEQLQNDLVASVTGVVSNWAMIEIARADPTLYEFLQQGKLEASALFDSSVATCEEMSNKIISNGRKTGTSPSEWVDLSAFEDWRESSEETADEDVVQAKDRIAENKGDSGITWSGQEKKGGKNQPPIDVEKDVIRAGYNLNAGRPANSRAAVAQTEAAPWYTQYWATPEEAEKWITSIVGTTTMRTCNDCEQLKTAPGKGVYSALEDEQRRIETGIRRLLESASTTYSAEDLAAISAPGYELTQQIIEALKTEYLYQEAIVERLAEEVAVVGVVERLIAARRLLLSGKKEANIAKNPDAGVIIDARIAELGAEMELLRQDAELRSATKQSVAVLLLERKSGREKFNTTVPEDNTAEALRKVTGRN